MSDRVRVWAYNQTLALAPKFILVTLADESNDFGLVSSSVENLKRKTGCDVKTVTLNLQKLKKDGYIQDSKLRDGKTKRVKILRILIPPKTVVLNTTKNGGIKPPCSPLSLSPPSTPSIPDPSLIPLGGGKVLRPQKGNSSLVITDEARELVKEMGKFQHYQIVDPKAIDLELKAAVFLLASATSQEILKLMEHAIGDRFSGTRSKGSTLQQLMKHFPDLRAQFAGRIKVDPQWVPDLSDKTPAEQWQDWDEGQEWLRANGKPPDLSNQPKCPRPSKMPQDALGVSGHHPPPLK